MNRYVISMNIFLFPSDQQDTQDIAQVTRRFSAEKLRLAPGESRGFRREDFDAFAQLGLAGMSVPESFGGSEVSNLTVAAVLYEIAKQQLGPAIYLSVHLMVARLISRLLESSSGTARDLLPKHLAALSSGEKLAAFCLTEAQAGSDAAALQTRAEKQGETWLLSGEKIYITSAGHADLYFVFARTSDSGGPKSSISAFLVERGAQGLSFGKPEPKMGCEGSPIASVTFNKTPALLVGALGEGYKRALEGLAGGRVNIAACACALSSRAIEIAQTHMLTRKQFGKTLSEFQGLQFLLSDMLIKLRASVLLTRDACQGSGSDLQCVAAIAKCFATDSAMAITTDAVQILGGAGYLKEYEVERLMRDAKMLQIVEGTNQIQRLILAKQLLSGTQ